MESQSLIKELYESGFQPYDGIILAYLPKMDALLQEHRGREYILYSLDGVAYDCLPPMKWWKVKEAARVHGLRTVEPIWSGCVADLRVPEVPKPEGTKLFVRGFSGGPWICLESREENNEEPGAAESIEKVNSPPEVGVV